VDGRVLRQAEIPKIFRDEIRNRTEERSVTNVEMETGAERLQTINLRLGKAYALLEHSRDNPNVHVQWP
jgi:hypothetical protein